MKRFQSRLLVCGMVAAAAMALAPAAQAGVWGVPSGSAQDFSYSNGQDINGLFGDPFIAGNQMFFLGTNFQANATAGTSDSVSDTVSFDIDINPGLVLSYVTVTAFGSYSVTGDGSSVSVSADLSIDELGGMSRSWNGSLLTDPVAFPVVSSGPSLTGAWSGVADVDVSFLIPQAHDLLHIEMENVLSALAVAGTGAAEINEQFQDIKFDFVFIPEPATLALLGLGGLVLLRRRR